jgi:hypothetical protein
LGLQAQQPEESPGVLLEPPVWQQGQQAQPVPLASLQQAPRELAEPASALLVQRASTAPFSLRHLSLPFPLWQRLRPEPQLPQLPESFSEPFPQRRPVSSSNVSSFP